MATISPINADVESGHRLTSSYLIYCDRVRLNVTSLKARISGSTVDGPHVYAGGLSLKRSKVRGIRPAWGLPAEHLLGEVNPEQTAAVQGRPDGGQRFPNSVCGRTTGRAP